MRETPHVPKPVCSCTLKSPYLRMATCHGQSASGCSPAMLRASRCTSCPQFRPPSTRPMSGPATADNTLRKTKDACLRMERRVYPSIVGNESRRHAAHLVLIFPGSRQLHATLCVQIVLKILLWSGILFCCAHAEPGWPPQGSGPLQLRVVWGWLCEDGRCIGQSYAVT